MKDLDKRYDNKDEFDQEELQAKFDEAKLGKKNPFDFERDMREYRRKLDKDYDIIETDKEYTQKLISCIDLPEYKLEKRLLRVHQRQNTLTDKLWVEKLMWRWQHIKKNTYLSRRTHYYDRTHKKSAAEAKPSK